MNNIVNRVQLIGRLGIDPEVRSLDNGRKMARFSIATDESYKDNAGNKVENTQWHNIVAWGPQAEYAAKFLKKGQLIALEGKLVSGSYTDKEGQKRYTTDVHAAEFMILASKKEAVAEGQ
jgi:single-strand DNA-binding protein